MDDPCQNCHAPCRVGVSRTVCTACAGPICYPCLDKLDPNALEHAEGFRCKMCVMTMSGD